MHMKRTYLATRLFKKSLWTYLESNAEIKKDFVWTNQCFTIFISQLRKVTSYRRDIIIQTKIVNNVYQTSNWRFAWLFSIFFLRNNKKVIVARFFWLNQTNIGIWCRHLWSMWSIKLLLSFRLTHRSIEVCPSIRSSIKRREFHNAKISFEKSVQF